MILGQVGNPWPRACGILLLSGVTIYLLTVILCWYIYLFQEPKHF